MAKPYDGRSMARPEYEDSMQLEPQRSRGGKAFIMYQQWCSSASYHQAIITIANNLPPPSPPLHPFPPFPPSPPSPLNYSVCPQNCHWFAAWAAPIKFAVEVQLCLSMLFRTVQLTYTACSLPCTVLKALVWFRS